jgi:hypothetical protein
MSQLIFEERESCMKVRIEETPIKISFPKPKWKHSGSLNFDKLVERTEVT